MKYLVAELTAKAVKVWYENQQICIRLEDEREIRFPVKKNKILNNASVEKVSNMEIICGGTGIHWPELNEDLSVTGILEGRFGR
ncbi:MAG: DUF2442 domain-containing protein [Bacteroidales bacterium]|nr:DUF2442 domain-containing protein [Bacteroidales bacterium]